MRIQTGPTGPAGASGSSGTSGSSGASGSSGTSGTSSSNIGSITMAASGTVNDQIINLAAGSYSTFYINTGYKDTQQPSDWHYPSKKYYSAKCHAGTGSRSGGTAYPYAYLVFDIKIYIINGYSTGSQVASYVYWPGITFSYNDIILQVSGTNLGYEVITCNDIHWILFENSVGE